MVLWYLLILIVSLVDVRICKEGFFPDYLGKEQCNAVKGVFILLVFLGHALADIRNCGFPFDRHIDVYAQSIHLGMGQLVVAMFLFYSGYGVMKSLLDKGKSYLKTYPRKRILATLLNFDLAVCCFILLAWIMGKQLGFTQIILSLIGWESAGNSNWYIFIILCCYLAFYLVFQVVGSRYHLGAVVFIAIALVGVMVLHEYKEPRWYNTLLVFPAGMVYAQYSDKLERWIQRWYGAVIASLIIVLLALHFMVRMHPLHGFSLNVKSIAFALLIVVLTMKVRIGNRWLYWCGFSLFPLYIYQRLPMIALRGIMGEGWICGHPSFFIGVCFVVTVGIALLYNRYLRIRLA